MRERRLTDSELACIGASFPTHLGEPEISVLVQHLLAEVKHRRAADLTEEDKKALRWLLAWDRLDGHAPNSQVGWAKHRAGLAVLDRLLDEVA